MNRDIKFRAWCDTDNGIEMVYFDKLECDNGLWFGYIHNHINEHLSIMQYTGLKDKNGVDIYEGDVVKHPEAVEPEHLGFKIVFKDFKFKAECVFYDEYLPEPIVTDFTEYFAQCEVIGNIHDNTELL